MKLKKLVEYYKDNPKNYWFKRKIYGWGWIPVKWQGWLVTFIGLIILVAGIYIGEFDDSPGATIIGLVLMIIFILFFCLWKGEKPHWQWGN